MRTKIFPYILDRVEQINIEKYGQLTCELCKQSIENEQFQYDHIIPVSKFNEFKSAARGSRCNGIRNLQIAHRKCNEQKSNNV